MKRKAHNRIEMAGKTFNSWLVLEIDQEKSAGKTLYWKCKCLECGDTYSVWGANLRSGLSKRCTKCGCGHGHQAQKGQTRTKRSSQESAHHYIYLVLRKSARKRGLSWSLSEDNVKILLTANCTYCGIPPGLPCSPLAHYQLSQKRTAEATFLRNGIDRIDSSKGYEPANVVTACEECNMGKSDRSTDDFLEWVHRVAAHMTKKAA